jgi:hypothetical protein
MRIHGPPTIDVAVVEYNGKNLYLTNIFFGEEELVDNVGHVYQSLSQLEESVMSHSERKEYQIVSEASKPYFNNLAFSAPLFMPSKDAPRITVEETSEGKFFLNIGTSKHPIRKLNDMESALLAAARSRVTE